MKNEKIMLKWLWILRITCITGVLIFVFFLVTSFKYWHIYFFFNATLILSYMWFNYSRIFINKVHKQYKLIENLKYTVVVPFYNEKRELLRDTIRSIISTDNLEKEIIIVDDGSENNLWEDIKNLKSKYASIRTFRFEKNKGKRFAHELAIKKSKYEFIVSIDSDTIIGKNAIVDLLTPFSDPEVGATTGNILIKNEKQNLLTRIQAGLYWVGLNIYKIGQSTQGNVVCCSGCFSAYRKEDLTGVLDEYVNQTFLGKKCHASEDRYLTNLINENGKKVLYVRNAICYTEAPSSLKKFIKQQVRWKRGFYRECLYTVTYSFKKSKLLYFENLIWLLMTPLLQLTMVLTTLFMLFFNFIHFVTFLLPMLLLFIIGRDCLFFMEEPKKAVWYLPYIVLYLFVLYPINIYTIFNSNPESWGTR